MLRILLFNILADSKLPNIFQILPCANSIVSPVSIVNTIEFFARILFAVVTKGPVAGCRVVAFRAFSEKVCTVPISGPTVDALTAPKTIFVSQISTANRTIDFARRDEILVNRIHVFLYLCSSWNNFLATVRRFSISGPSISAETFARNSGIGIC
jgi:hypothetical protein